MDRRVIREEKKDHLVLVVSGLVIVLLAALYFYHFWFQNQSPPAPASVAPVGPVAETPAPAGPQVRHPISSLPDAAEPLPSLEDSDGPIGQALGEMLDAKTLARLFQLDSLVRRFVVTLDELPRKKLPQKYSLAKPVAGKFVVAGAEESLIVASRNYQRYTPYLVFAETIDVGRLVTVYRHFYPLLQEEYRNLGQPTKYFNDRVVEAIDDLLATPELTDAPRLVQNKVYYEYADPALEERSAGQKIMLRMGNDNAARAKAVLREIRGAIVSTQ